MACGGDTAASDVTHTKARGPNSPLEKIIFSASNGLLIKSY